MGTPSDTDALSGDRPADFNLGAFSGSPPWTIDADRTAMRWRRVVPSVRWAMARDLPDLIRPRRFPPGVRVVTVVWRIGLAVAGWWLIGRRRGGSESKRDLSRRIRRAAEKLGPTYIKLAQIISSGEGLFPDELVSELKLLRDKVPAESFDDVRAVVESELGQSLERVFSSFDRQPIAAASIAQVHRATLRTGEHVVVKVQRPSVGKLVHEDIRVLAWLAPFLVGRIPVAALANPPALIELFAATIVEELDFRLEADNMLEVAQALAGLDERGYIVPRPHPTLVTPRVLVMERFDGFAFYDLEGMRGAGIDTEEVIRTGMVGFMEGAMIHGIFHGDLHGGNLLVLADGQVVLLDFGITGRLDDQRRMAFLRLLIGGTMNDLPGQMRALIDLGALPADTDIDAVITDLGLDGPPIDPTQLTPDEMIRELQGVMKKLLAYGARLPKELMLFVKNMIFVDGAIATMAPDLDLFAEITSIATHFATAHGARLVAEVGIDPSNFEVDLGSVKNTIGISAETDRLTYRELQERRELIRSRLHGRHLS